MNMDLCDSLVWRGAQIDMEIRPQACQISLRDFSKEAFPNPLNKVICDVDGDFGRRSC